MIEKSIAIIGRALAIRERTQCLGSGCACNLTELGPVDGLSARLFGKDDELPLGAVLFHEAMGLDDLV